MSPAAQACILLLAFLAIIVGAWLALEWVARKQEDER